jgi:hypothetical protein
MANEWPTVGPAWARDRLAHRPQTLISAAPAAIYARPVVRADRVKSIATILVLIADLGEPRSLSELKRARVPDYSTPNIDRHFLRRNQVPRAGVRP